MTTTLGGVDDSTVTEFAILGRLEVRGRSGLLHIGGRRRRQLLAYLLVNANTRLSVERIVDDVWDGAPPDGAAATVRTYVSQYRKLDVAGSGLVVTADPAGYDVRLDRDDLDATKFEDAVRAARPHAAEDRLAVVDTALNLWRGPPLDEFAGSGWADVEALRLHLLHEQAERERFDIMLELGRHEACIPDLERSLTASPLDERLAAQLSLAHYRAGRVSEALRDLAGVRRRLGEQLGLSPGAEIVDLERRMIERDPDLDGRSSEPPAGTRPTVVKSGQVDGTPRPLPDGTVTFLFTDIEGSTRMLSELGDGAYAEMLGTHRHHVSAAVERHRGVVVGMEGDSHFCAFGSASAAARAAAEAQQALRAQTWALPLRVRMGLHSGEALVVGEDYVGTTVHVAARVAAAAHGGQVVASDACRALGPEELWHDLGWHRLKDVERSHRLYELDTGHTMLFPPLSTADNVPSNLPAALDEFVGREDECAHLAELVGHVRLVTLVGPGGVGKTRLATESARSLRASHPGGVHLVPLAQVTSGDDVAATVTRTLVEAGGRGADMRAVVHNVVRDDATLIVLDNCEHVLAAASSLVSDLLGHVPTLRVIATSREPLRVRGERVVRVDPLHVDAGDNAVSAAAQLFAVRAEAATGRAMTATDARLVRRICAAVDGLPLAIELAASRTASLALVDIAARLGDRFELLRSAHDQDDGRHRTLEAVVRWSYELLSPTDRALFNRLSVFADAFAVDAAVAVAGDTVGGHVLDALARLVDKSLVQLTVTGRGSSYRLLDTLRSFGRDRLSEAGQLTEAEDRLLEWAMSITDRLERDMRTERQDESLSAAVPYRSNIRTALEIQLVRGRPLEALRIVASVPVDTPGERMRLIDRLIPAAGDELQTLGRAHLAASNLEFERGAFEAGVAHAERAGAVFTLLGDRRSVAWAAFLATFGAWGVGDIDAARAAIAAARAGFAELDDRLGAANAAWAAVLLEPDLAAAERLGATAESQLREVSAPFALAHCLEARSVVGLQLDRTSSCPSWLAEALGIFAASGNDGCVAHCLEAVAAFVVSGHEASTHGVTAELLGAAEALRVASGHRHRPWELEGQRAALDRLRRSLTPDQLAAAVQRGRGHHAGSAVELANRALSSLPG